MGKNLLGAAFVEAETERQRIAAGVGDAEHVEHGRYLCFTAGAMQPFGDIEDQVGTDLSISLKRIEVGFDQCDLVARGQGRFHCLDGMDVVPFGV